MVPLLRRLSAPRIILACCLSLSFSFSYRVDLKPLFQSSSVRPLMQRVGQPTCSHTHILPSLRLRGGGGDIQEDEPARGQEEYYNGFPVLRASDGEVLEVEGLCMHCSKQGTNRIMPSTIPWFGRIVVSSFECKHCGNTNQEVQAAAEIQPLGRRTALHAARKEDVNRQVMRSRHASIIVPELQLEMPAASGGAVLTTVEGILTRAAEDLDMNQAERRESVPEQAIAIDSVIEALRSYAQGGSPFTFVLDDPSGNSHIEGDATDKALSITQYERTEEQSQSLGILAPQQDPAPASHETSTTATREIVFESALGGGGRRNVSNIGAVHWVDGAFGGGELQEMGKEVEKFQVTCPACRAQEWEKMYVTSIPHFGELIIMCLSCDSCGYRSTDVKPGAKIADRGKRLTLSVKESEDWDRLVLKSHSCTLGIPELDLEIESGSMGATLSTVEGLLDKVFEHLRSTRPFTQGDSFDSSNFAKRLNTFLDRFGKLKEEKQACTLVLDDPSGLSNVEPSKSSEGGHDERLSCVEYDREFDVDGEEPTCSNATGYFETLD